MNFIGQARTVYQGFISIALKNEGRKAVCGLRSEVEEANPGGSFTKVK